MTARQASWRLALLLLIVGVGVVVAVTVGLPSVTQLREGFARFGPWAAVVFVLGYAVATLSPLPKSLFTLAAGAVFGVAVGVLVVMAGATLGALVAFYLARLLGREGVHRLTWVRADRFDARLERHGLLAVLVARLVPVVPFTAVNYLAGLTGLGVRVFVVGTVLGILPATTMYAVLGAYGSEPGSLPFQVALASLVALTVAAGIGGAWRRRRSRRVSTPSTETSA